MSRPGLQERSAMPRRIDDPSQREAKLRFVRGSEQEPAVDQREVLATRLAGYIDELDVHAGPVGRRLLVEVSTRQRTVESFRNELLSLPDFAEFQKSAIKYLEGLGVVEEIEGQLIVDIQKIVNFSGGYVPRPRHGNKTRFLRSVSARQGREDVADITGEQYVSGRRALRKYKQYFETGSREFLYNAFYGKRVISKVDWGDSQREYSLSVSRPMFYAPKDRATAFDMEQIRHDDSHLGLWEIRTHSKTDTDFSIFPDGVAQQEAEFAFALYNQRRGNARRENGQLVVNYKDGVRGPVSLDWFDSCSNVPIRNTERAAGRFMAAPYRALSEGQMPDLVANDLLRPDDFRIMNTEQNRTFIVRRPLNQEAGLIVLNDNVRYTLGRALGGKRVENGPRKGETKYHACVISERLGGVIEIGEDGEEKLVRIFDLLNPERDGLEKQATSASTSTILYSAPKGKINLRPYDERSSEVYLSRKPGESEDDFGKRVDAFNFATLLKARQEVSLKSGVSLDALSPHEQAVFIDYYQRCDAGQRDELYNFIKIFKQDGLRAFLLLQVDSNGAEKIFSVAEGHSVPEAAAIYEKIAEISSRAETADAEAQEFFVQKEKSRELDRPRLTEEIIKRAGRVLAEYAGNKRAKKMRDFLAELDSIDADMALFVSMFKMAYKGRKDVDFSEVKGLQLETKTLAELQENTAEMSKLVEEMLAVHARNRNDQGQAGKDSAKKLKEYITQGKGDSMFYFLKKDGKLVCFLRIDDLPGLSKRKYFASFNVSPALKGGGIGEAMYFAVVEEEIRKDPEVVIELIFHTQSPACSLYSKTGCLITGLDKSGNYFTAERNLSRSEHLISTKLDKVAVASMYESSKDFSLDQLISAKERVIVRQFEEVAEDDEAKAMTTKLVGAGYVGTQYFYVDEKDKKRRYYVFEKEKAPGL